MSETKVLAGLVPSEAEGRSAPGHSPRFWWPLMILGVPWPVAASHPPSLLHVHLVSSPWTTFLIKTSVLLA